MHGVPPSIKVCSGGTAAAAVQPLERAAQIDGIRLDEGLALLKRVAQELGKDGSGLESAARACDLNGDNWLNETELLLALRRCGLSVQSDSGL